MLTLSTGSLYNYGLNRVFALAAEVGFDGMEVLIDGRRDTRDASYLRRLSSEYKLPIAALHSPFVPYIQGWPSDQLGRLKQTVALARELSVPLVVTHLPMRLHAAVLRLTMVANRRFLLPLPWVRRESYYRFFRDSHVDGFELSSGVTIAVENMPAVRFLGIKINPCWFNASRDLLRFPHLTLDTTHLGTWGLDPITFYEQLSQRVAHVHLSNYDGREHRLPPNGRLALPYFLRSLARNSYRGAVSLETSPSELESENEDKCRVNLKRTLAFCRKHFTL
ncbi:sugar phosphate isomerase/epimerase family protein [Thermodesulfobacteriota bacterium]